MSTITYDCNVHIAVKRVEKAMRQKLSVEQGEEDDEGEDNAVQQGKDSWGKGKRGYYGADTEDYEVC